MRSYVQLAGACVEVASALFEVSYNPDDPTFTCLLTTLDGDVFWLAGTSSPQPRIASEIAASRFRVAARGVEDLIRRLCAIDLQIDPRFTLALRAQHQLESVFYLTALWLVAERFPVKLELTAHLVDLEHVF